MNTQQSSLSRESQSRGRLIGQKAPLKLKDIWAIRIRLQLADSVRDLALFNLAIDSKLRACDLVKWRVRDVCHGERVASRAIVVQQKTGRPVQFEITDQMKESIAKWIAVGARRPDDFLFPSRIEKSPHLSTRQYARIVHAWVPTPCDPRAYRGLHHGIDLARTHALRCSA